MGTEEAEPETITHPTMKEPMDKDCESSVDSPQTPDSTDADKWNTGSKGGSEEAKEAAAGPSPSSTMDKLHKASTNKWKTVQNWRKAFSEDSGEKPTNGKGAEGSKDASKSHGLGSLTGGGRKNPFRRALSEPPGVLFNTVVQSSSSTPHSSSSTADLEALGASPTTDPGQKGAGGGALFKKYLRTVSQKLKRPRLRSQSSNPALLNDVVELEPARVSDLSWTPLQEVPLWDISNCVLEQGQILIAQEEEPTMWTRNRGNSFLSNLSMQNLVPDIDKECSPENVGLSGPRPKNQEGGVRGLIKRRLENKAKRTSATSVGLLKGNRLYGSSNSISIPVLPSLDLNTDTTTVIRPVHSSILGEKYCFEVINSENTHCFGCTSLSERDRWIEELRRAAQPNKDNIERTENSLSLWVNEAKDLLPKKRYYCELHLDGTLFARTSSRAVGKSSNRSSLAGETVMGSASVPNSSGGCQLFWGEFFELDNLPSISQITLHLFRDEDPKKKRLSRDESTLYPLGSVSIALAEIRGRTYLEKWYPIVPFKASGAAGAKEMLGAQASLRIKARFQNLKVLPMEKYKEFAEYVTLDYVEMCTKLEPLLNVKEKEELAGALVHVLQSIGKAKEFLIDLGSAEVERLGENDALIFRENTLATKAIDEYMKLVGQRYLIDTLGDFIARLYSSVESYEVDSKKCPASDLANNQQQLKDTCEEVVKKIVGIQGPFPEELNKIFSSWKESCEDQGKPEIGQRLISASLFLRFLCPAVLSPSLFNLAQPYPEPATARTLTLTAKVIQNLANFTLFGEKEEYMLFMNDFLEQHWDDMRGFLQTVSNADTEIPMTSFDGYVDLPLRLAVLHGLLVDIIYQRNPETIDKLYPLPSILNQISDSLGPEAHHIIVSSETGQTKPTYVPPKDLPKHSPLQSSIQQLHLETKAKDGSQLSLYKQEATEALKRANPAAGDLRARRSFKERKPVHRTQSAPHRSAGHKKFAMKRQTSSENLPTADDQQGAVESNQPHITLPQTNESIKRTPAPVPWIKVNQNRDSSEIKTETEEFNVLDQHTQELSELRLGIEQVTERELDMAKRLEDFINQNQDQNALLQEQNTALHVEVSELRSLLATAEEQLASAAFRLGVIEEEREEDEKRLSVAIAAAQRVNVLEEQVAGLQKHLNEAYSGQNNIQRTHVQD